MPKSKRKRKPKRGSPKRRTPYPSGRISPSTIRRTERLYKKGSAPAWFARMRRYYEGRHGKIRDRYRDNPNPKIRVVYGGLRAGPAAARSGYLKEGVFRGVNVRGKKGKVKDVAGLIVVDSRWRSLPLVMRKHLIAHELAEAASSFKGRAGYAVHADANRFMNSDGLFRFIARDSGYKAYTIVSAPRYRRFSGRRILVPKSGRGDALMYPGDGAQWTAISRSWKDYKLRRL